MWIRVIHFHIQLWDGSEDSPREDPESKPSNYTELEGQGTVFPSPSEISALKPHSLITSWNNKFMFRTKKWGNRNVTAPYSTGPVKPVEVEAGLVFSNKLNAAQLSCGHAGLLGPLKPFHHPFPLAVSASCHGAHSSAKNLQEASREPARSLERIMSPCGKMPLQWGSCFCRIMVQSLLQSTELIPSPNAGDWPLPKANTLSPGQVGTYMMQSGTAGKDKVGGGQGFLSPRYPQEPMDLRHEPAAANPCKGAFAGPFCSHLFLVCFAFCPLGLCLFLGIRSGPGHFASSAVQHCWSRHAPAWELLLPASLLQSLPARTTWWQFSTSKCRLTCTHAAFVVMIIAHPIQKHVWKREARQDPYSALLRNYQSANISGKKRLRNSLG